MSAIFAKMTGSGNDFVMLDGRYTDLTEWPVPRIREICDRRNGVGGDGLVILTPRGSDRVELVYFNSDGSRAELCGNAALCTVRLAARLEIADGAGMVLLTDAGEVEGRVVGNGWQAEVHLADAVMPTMAQVDLEAGEEVAYLSRIGVPHLVTVVADVTRVDLPKRGATLRHHPALGADGANANFISRISSDTRSPEDASWAIRTFERGVEGETLACGTGTVAAALTVVVAGLDQLPLRFTTAGGRPLAVQGSVRGKDARDLWLCGEGRLVGRGVWEG